MKQRVLFIDDELAALKAYERCLRSHQDEWDMVFDSCPLAAWERLQNSPFDTVVSDMKMPGMTGIELLQRMKADAALNDIPVVIVTGDSDQQWKRQALDMDAADLLSKPVHTDDLVARVRSALRLKRYADQLKRSNQILEHRVRERTAALASSQIDIIWRLGKAAEHRDEDTANHVIRVGCYSRIIAKQMGLDETACDTLFLAAPLHDIGKIGIPDSILNKPGPLSTYEWQIMKSHCAIGESILRSPCKLLTMAAKFAGAFSSCLPTHIPNNPVIEMAATIAATHHEKWDGAGYPHGLAGDDIPLVGRIVAVADVYDALRSPRPYKDSINFERTIEILKSSAPTQFDPDVFQAFLSGMDEIRSIERQFSDDTNQLDNSLPSIDTGMGYQLAEPAPVA
ncbi:MAG: response regulator [Pirellulaceae bacterium]